MHIKLEVRVKTSKMAQHHFSSCSLSSQLLTLPPNDRLLALNSIWGPPLKSRYKQALGNRHHFSHKISIFKVPQCSLEFCRNKTHIVLWTYKPTKPLPSLERSEVLTFSRHRAPPRNSLAGFSLIIIHNLFLQKPSGREQPHAWNP